MTHVPSISGSPANDREQAAASSLLISMNGEPSSDLLVCAETIFQQ